MPQLSGDSKDEENLNHQLRKRRRDIAQIVEEVNLIIQERPDTSKDKRLRVGDHVFQ